MRYGNVFIFITEYQVRRQQKERIPIETEEIVALIIATASISTAPISTSSSATTAAAAVMIEVCVVERSEGAMKRRRAVVFKSLDVKNCACDWLVVAEGEGDQKSGVGDGSGGGRRLVRKGERVASGATHKCGGAVTA